MRRSSRGHRPERTAASIRQSLDHVAATSLFNDAVDSRFSTAHAAMDDGKKLRCHRGPFGPAVTPDAVPPGAHGLRIQGRLNGRLMQNARTDQLIFKVPAVLIA